MSIQTMAMSDLGETLMTLGFDASEILSKMWFCLRMVSTSEEVSVKIVDGGLYFIFSFIFISFSFHFSF